MNTARPTLPDCFSLQGLRILLTGHASGIGAATAGLLMARQARLACVDQTLEPASDPATPQPELALQQDLSSRAACESAVEQAAQALGGLDALVHCAATLTREPIEQVSDESLQRQLDVNLAAPLHLCRAAHPWLAHSGRGRIVLFSSQGAYTGGYVGSTVYAMTKAAVGALGRSLARQWAPEGILVNMVAPGAVDTPMLHQGSSEEALSRFLQLAPLGRAGTPMEMAGCVAFLLSPAAAYVTGHTLDANGGMLMR